MSYSNFSIIVVEFLTFPKNLSQVFCGGLSYDRASRVAYEVIFIIAVKRVNEKSNMPSDIFLLLSRGQMREVAHNVAFLIVVKR